MRETLCFQAFLCYDTSMKQTMIHPQNPLFDAQSVAAELHTVCDFVRYGVSMFTESELSFGHGTDNAFDESVFMVLEGLHLPIDTLDPYWNARLTTAERLRLATLIHERIKTRKPASYLLNKAYIQGFGFYVDERVIVPRSFLAEILARDGGFSKIADYEGVGRVLDLCTGSGCLAILAAQLFPNAQVDAVDLSPDALAVARRNVDDYGLKDRVHLYQGDLFAPLSGKKYDLILTNPPYVDEEGMSALTPEYRHEPALALAAGKDGLDIVHKIIENAGQFLENDGGLLCELGRCGPALQSAYPGKPFLWLDTEQSSGEVFWIEKQDL